MFYFISYLSFMIQFFLFLLKILWNRIVTTFLSNKTLPFQNCNSGRRHSTSMPIFDLQPEASDVWRDLPRSRVVLRDPDLRRERRDQPERQIHKNRIFRERSDVLHESSDWQKSCRRSSGEIQIEPSLENCKARLFMINK